LYLCIRFGRVTRLEATENSLLRDKKFFDRLEDKKAQIMMEIMI
jgi:hypothetical protein